MERPIRRWSFWSGPKGLRTLGVLCVIAGAAHLPGCARPGRPPGGPEDRIPPMVVSTWPDTFQIIEPTRDPVVISFNERISERLTTGRLSDAVLVSPETGEVEVKHTRSGLEISVLGGLKPGLVYRVRVLNTIKDLFNNTMENPFELVFSTGGAYEEHVLAGVVTDRITGEKVEQARVEARGIPEQAEGGPEKPAVPVYVARTDSAGIFVLRYVPSGGYDITIYQDNNRNRMPDFRELQGTTSAQVGLLIPRQDTIIREVALLQPDTTPARLIRVTAEDSTLLHLSFDDFLMPGEALSPVQVTLTREGEDAPAVVGFLWERELDSIRALEDSVRVADSLRTVTDALRGTADSLQAVLATLEAAGDTVEIPGVERALEAVLGRLEPPPPARGGREEEARREAPVPILPESSFFARLQRALVPNQLYQVFVTGVRNINGLRDGGGETGVTWEPPEPPPGDTALSVPDSPVAPPDTAAAPRETSPSRGRRDPGPVHRRPGLQ